MKKIIIFFAILVLLNLCFLKGYDYYNYKKINKFILPDNTSEKTNEDEYIEQITALKNKYNNSDVVGILTVTNTDFRVPIVQAKNNNYYLYHLPDKTSNYQGSIFLDYRVDIYNSKKLLIYGHSSEKYELPIEIIEEYYNKDFYDKHKYIELDTINEPLKYEIFSIYVETSDFDYTKVDFSNDEEWLEHLNKLKQKSLYDTGIYINKDDKILIIQTCSTLSEYKNYNKKFFLVIAKLV